MYLEISKKVYEEFYGKPLSEITEQMLHTAYEDRSGVLSADSGAAMEMSEAPTQEVPGLPASGGSTPPVAIFTKALSLPTSYVPCANSPPASL